MEADHQAGLVECVLFLENEPVELDSLMRATGLGRRAVLGALARLREEYAGAPHGLELVELADGYTLSPRGEYWETLKARYGRRNEAKLSRAALETLSIIAYSQPITRQEIEAIRGVSADGMIKLLLSRQVIREVGKREAPGRPIQYGTTKEFLRMFRLSSIAELPKMDELDKEKFEEGE
ncbi:MAG: SMC-Scp complex subunit ScpB [Spirochaetales bacterium]|nr:SMC-Scp complex subunit ScpB [Spirochaetales bacterium]